MRNFRETIDWQKLRSTEAHSWRITVATQKLDYSSLPMTTATANTTYVVETAMNRTIQNGTMIDIDATQGLKFVLNGTLHSGGNMLAYGTQGQNAPAIDIVVGKTGFLDSKYEGLYASADESSIVNHGMIVSGTGEAIEMHGDGLRVENDGVINSQNDSIYLTGADIRVENSGTINGSVRIASDLGATSTIVNSGQINSPSIAVLGGAGDDTFINSGLVRVGVRLNDGDDRFIDRGGHVTSAVQGGDGDDTYIIKSKDFDLRESVLQCFSLVHE